MVKQIDFVLEVNIKSVSLLEVLQISHLWVGQGCSARSIRA